MIPTDVDVAIIGCGPVGALMGNLLAGRGVRTAVLEREVTEHGIPRAFSCDDEALRVYQQAGLADELLAEMVQCPIAEFADARGEAFATLRFGGLDFGNGFSALNFFHQPALEAALRRGLLRFERASLHLGAEVEGLSQDAEGVTLSVRDRVGGNATEVRARYALGCDGRRSAARRLCGIDMAGSRYAETWIALSGEVDAPPPTMPHARFVCDPARPGFVARGAAGQCRWEFMLRPGETAAEMERPEAAAALIAPYVDPARVRITRSSTYTFENKVASRWREGRLLLLGDAAHTMPPMMGQGLVSGLRDAANLAWKLHLVLRGAAGEGLLDTYEEERRAHTRAMSDISVRLGYVFLARAAPVVWARDRLIRALDKIPRVHRFIRDVEFKPPAIYARGFMAGGRRRGGPEGTLMPQPRVRAGGREVRLDDALGPGFTLLGMNADPAALLPPAGEEAPWAALGARALRVVPAGSAGGEGDVVDVEGKLGPWFSRHRVAVALVRPDRFVFGAGPPGDAPRLWAALRDALLGAGLRARRTTSAGSEGFRWHSATRRVS